MKNKILAITRNIIAYVKELRVLPLIKSSSDALLMQQLDYWFFRYPNGFFKFLQPCDHESYRQGDSWCEELFFSSDEFRTAFSHIGIAYKSKKQFDLATDKFQGKYYCSYFDRVSKKTFYFRNHPLVDQYLDGLTSNINSNHDLYKFGIYRNGESQFIGSITLSDNCLPEESSIFQETEIYRNGESPFTEMENPHLQKQGISICNSIYTEITSENTPETPTPHPQIAVCEEKEKATPLEPEKESKTSLISKRSKPEEEEITSDYPPVKKYIPPVPPVAKDSQQENNLDWEAFEKLVKSEIPSFRLQATYKRMYKDLVERLFLLGESRIKSFLNWRLNALKNASVHKDKPCNLITVLNSLNNDFRYDDPTKAKVEGLILEWESLNQPTVETKVPSSLSLREKRKRQLSGH